jgi:hypothetical protein
VSRPWPRTDDRRSFRVALVADRFLNPPASGLDAIPILIEAGWGVVQLPSDSYPREVAGQLLEQVAEQAEEFHRHGYDVVVIGVRSGLREALAAARVPELDALEPVSARELRSFLTRRPPPRAAAHQKKTARRPARAAAATKRTTRPRSQSN